jgi:pyruvate/2-oxoglutarate dehydrogenase complex dihydrolipoamide dehydrogenase (E3) component
LRVAGSSTFKALLAFVLAVCDTDTILQLGRVPKDILIVGGGPVGVEFATICHALGARVTVADLGDRLMPMMDGEMSSRMAGLFTGWGIRVLGCTAEAVNATAGKVQVSLSTGEILEPDPVLFAAGGTMHTIMNMSMATPTYSYAYKYAAFDGLRRLAKIQETEGAIK